MLCLIFALKKVFLEEREKKRDISPLFSLSLSSDEKKSTDTRQNNKKEHTTKEDLKMREKREKKTEKTNKRKAQLLKFFREKTEEEKRKIKCLSRTRKWSI